MSQNLEVANVAVYLPDNRKRIICIDGYNTGRMSADRCNCKGPKNDRETSITLGVMDCVGIRGLKGSNNGTATEFNHCTVVGLGVGFRALGRASRADQLHVDRLHLRIHLQPVPEQLPGFGAGSPDYPHRLSRRGLRQLPEVL